MSVILAIDQSTSASKALVYNAQGQLIEKVSREHRQIYPQPGWVEHDAEEIWNNSLALLQSLASKHSDILCLSITNQRETIVVFDRTTGKPLCNALVWQDQRSDSICKELIGKGFDPIVNRKTGLKIDTYFSASKLTWLMGNKPEIASRLKSGEALIGTMDSYLIYRLNRGKVHATDHTNASRTLLLDINKLAWDEELCNTFEVPMGALPEVRFSTGRFGETNLDGALSRPIPICGVMGDSQASLFAHRCYEPGMAKATLGTGCSVLLNLGDKLQLNPQAAVSTIAWTHEGKATYSFEGIINCAAATITWLKDQLKLISEVSETQALAESVADNGGVYLVPAFAGLGAPYWESRARGAIVGMTISTTKNHIVRAALESIAYQIRDVLDAMKSDLKVINTDGGATKNTFLMQFIADLTGLEIRVSDVPDCSPLGAALAGLLGMGVCKSFDELQKLPRDVTLYRPKMPRAEVERLYHGWKNAVVQTMSNIER